MPTTTMSAVYDDYFDRPEEPDMPEPLPARVSLTIAQKRARSRQEPPLKRWELAVWAMDAFQLGKPPSDRTIMHICKHESVSDEEKALNSKRRMDEAFRAFDEALATWVREKIEKQEQLSGAMIKRKAQALSDAMQTTRKVKFLNGWLCSFQQRHG